eukprot:scaffold5298_cov131-Isochrysis_galbana.AAC.4
MKASTHAQGIEAAEGEGRGAEAEAMETERQKDTNQHGHPAAPARTPHPPRHRLPGTTLSDLALHQRAPSNNTTYTIADIGASAW